MKLRALLPALIVAIGTATPAASRGAPAARAGGAAGNPRDRAAHAPERSPSRDLARSADRMDPESLALASAAFERSLGNLPGVVRCLEPIDFAVEPSFAAADRAAFLLGQTYLELGSRARFLALAAQVARWNRKSDYTAWLEYQRLLVAIPAGDTVAADRGGAGGSPRDPQLRETRVGNAASNALAAAVLLRAGDAESALRLLSTPAARDVASPLALHLEAIALERLGRDDRAVLEALTTAETATALGRDLAGAAAVRLATRALARGEDPSAVLARVPGASRYALRARHMLGMLALERGDAGAGAGALESLLAEDSTYVDRREVRLALAGRELERARWEDAHTRYRYLDPAWRSDRAELERRLATGEFDDLWAAWRANPQVSEVLVLDALPARLLAEHLALASSELPAAPEVDVPPLFAPQPGTHGAAIAPPPAASWEALANSEKSLGDAAYELERTRWAAERERQRLGDLREYLDRGLARAARERVSLVASTATLDSLARGLDSLDTRLRQVRDEEIRRVARRTAAIRAEGARSELWMRGMRQLGLGGPGLRDARVAPPGATRPESLLAAESRHARTLRESAERLAAEAPERITRSYERAWRPGLIERVGTLGAAARSALAWTRALEVAIDSSRAAAAGSEELRLLEARAAVLAGSVDSLRTAHQALRTRIAREAVERGRLAMDGEREAIDYGLAASSYARSVSLGDAREAAPLPRSARRPADSLAADAERDDPETARWREDAIGALRGFLDRHPASAARAEARFRLADLLLVDARIRFHREMEGFVAGGPDAPRGLPVLTHAPALDLYRRILAEDPGFEHRDAVLFNAGMILADQGDLTASGYFEDLVRIHPGSVYCQEAYLRMGDMRFDEKRFEDGVKLYERAARGPDVGLTAIALYKTGWAHYNEDRFPAAVDAFRQVLDLYGSPRRAEIQADIENEAEAYLVHSLAGAGGAPAFAATFQRIGPRSYEVRVLMALGQHFRRYGEYPQAAAVDELCLTRYPLRSEALLSATRLIETYQRSHRPALEREARLRLAEHFAPGGPWIAAQSSDSLRVAAADFARGSWRTVAFQHHAEARRTGNAADWREALRLYETLLAKWPAHGEAPALELSAGEACFRLGDHPAALRHDRAAAAAGDDSLASLALWQCVAVTDAWYESTRARGAAPAATGSDTLARAVIDAGDQLLARFPTHPNGADLVWRQSQLAFAHGWYPRAATDLGRMIERHPSDTRVPVAAGQRGEALFRLGDYGAAGAAFEVALESARRAGRDSLALRAEQAIPVCAYRDAEARVAADSTLHAEHAARFAEVARRWPRYELAHLAQYRAGLAWIAAGRNPEGIAALRTLVNEFPKSEYVRDASLHIAQTLEPHDPAAAAGAYIDFARAFPGDEGERGAWLHAADLLDSVSAGDPGSAAGARAEALRIEYLARYPDDVEGGMEILEALARRELTQVTPERPVSTLLRAAAAKGRAAPAPSRLVQYLERGRRHPDLVARDLIAQLRFLEAEESRTAFTRLPLTQPLVKSLAAKQRMLDTLIARYKRSADLGVGDWTHAATFRIGEALVEFGEALERSQRPADLSGDDLLAYEEVLMEQGHRFSDRGEDVWADLLREKSREVAADPWIERTQGALWRRMADRFLFRPEVEFPLIGSNPAASPKGVPNARGKSARDGARSAAEPHNEDGRTVARPEGNNR